MKEEGKKIKISAHFSNLFNKKVTLFYFYVPFYYILPVKYRE